MSPRRNFRFVSTFFATLSFAACGEDLDPSAHFDASCQNNQQADAASRDTPQVEVEPTLFADAAVDPDAAIKDDGAAGATVDTSNTDVATRTL